MSLVALVAAAVQQPPAPPRDTPRPAAGVASISGRVTDRDSGQPLRRMRVLLSTAGFTQGPQFFEGVTDADGRYEIAGIPAGDYYATAGPDEFGAGHQSRTFGQYDSTPSLPLRPPLSLKAGEKRGDIDFALARTYAVEGRVTNELGEPLAELGVLSERIDRPGSAGTTTTDDRGFFRLYGFAPGSWRVCAKAPNRDAPPADDPPQQFVRTCFPPENAGKTAAIEIRNADVPGVAIQMQRERAYAVSGTVVDETGAPVPRASVEVRRVERDNFGFGGTTAEFRGGTFVARGLTAGDYVVHANVFEPPNPYGLPSGSPRQQGLTPFRIDAADVGGIVVAVSRGADIAGRVLFDGDPAPALRGLQMRIGAHRAGDGAQLYSDLGPPQSVAVKEDLTFAMTGAHGPLVLDVSNPPAGWIVKSVRYGETEIAGVPTEFTSGARSPGVQVVLTNRVARLTIRPVDGEGRPAAAFVFLMAANRPQPSSGSLYPRLPQADGTLAPVTLLPGEYVTVALGPEDAARVMRNADEMQTLSAKATRIALKEGDHPTIDVRISTLAGNR